MIKKKLKLLLLPLLALTWLNSCSWEKEAGVPQAGNNNEVVFSMRVPASHTLTRSLTEADEYEVKTLDVLLFEYKSDGSGTLLSRSTHSGTPKVTGRNVDFYVRLEKDENVTDYDFILLANARDLISEKLYSGSNLNVGLTKSEVQAALKDNFTAGTGWIANSSDPLYKAMPMWGELINETIEAGKTYGSNTPTPLLRSTVKIDIEVDLENTDKNFDLEEVWYYNYNTEGYIVPLAGNLTDNKATAPSIDGLTLNTTTPIDYTSGISSDKQTLINTIYGFEGPKGSMDDDKYMENPCLLIKGTFDGMEGWYRLDFANVDPDDLSTNYLALLRNHQYNVTITAINGPGFPGPDEALNSKPGNISTKVTQWDNENVGGIWNGNYEIKFSTLKVDFTQFGEPSPQVVTITTNCPKLTFENFTNINSGAADTEWGKTIINASTEKWTNNHFRLEIVTGDPDSQGNRTYTMTISSDRTVDGDGPRETRFKIKGSNMEATFQITQDRHTEYQLITDPNQIVPIMLDGAIQRIPIKVTSTHPYSVLLNDPGLEEMFSGIYDEATDGALIGTLNVGADNIGVDITTIYIETKPHSAVSPRVNTFVIKHTDDASSVSPLTFNVLQVSPIINAVLEVGGYTANLRKAGGSVKINLISNISEWIPVLNVKIGNGADTPVTSDTDLDSYFGIHKGSGSMAVTFTAPAITGDEDYIYTITFKDTNGATVTSPEIVVTQFAKLPGEGGGGTPPTGGVRAEQFILSVDENGVLNLDGNNRPNNWLVYFRWGSAIAISGGDNQTIFDANQIAWTPEGYDYNALMLDIGSYTAANAWGKVPYANSTIHSGAYAAAFPHDNTGAQLADGLGDPCKLAVKDGVVGGFRMPTGLPYNGYSPSSLSGWTDINGMVGRYNLSGDQFYPAAGYLDPNNGKVGGVNTTGAYWSVTTDGALQGSYLGFYATEVTVFGTVWQRPFAMTVRCVPE